MGFLKYAVCIDNIVTIYTYDMKVIGISIDLKCNTWLSSTETWKPLIATPFTWLCRAWYFVIRRNRNRFRVISKWVRDISYSSRDISKWLRDISKSFRDICLNNIEISLNSIEVSLNYLKISLIHLEISLNLEIFLNHLEISLNRLWLNLNYGYALVVRKDTVFPWLYIFVTPNTMSPVEFIGS